MKPNPGCHLAARGTGHSAGSESTVLSPPGETEKGRAVGIDDTKLIKRTEIT